MAAVRVVLPWSTWPMVPMLTCGLLRSNFAFATAGPPQDCDDPPCDPSSGHQGVRGWIWSWPMDGQHPWWTSLWLTHRAFRYGRASGALWRVRIDPAGDQSALTSGLLAVLLRGVGLLVHDELRSSVASARCVAHSPFCFAMMVFATLVGT